MATYTATAAQANQPPIYNVNGSIDRVVQYTFTSSATANDVVQMVRVPAGAIIAAVNLAVSYSAGVTTVNIGDGNDTSAYGASVVLSGSVVALTSMTYRGLGRSYSAEDTIDVTIASTSAPPGDGKITMRVCYIIQNGGQ